MPLFISPRPAHGQASIGNRHCVGNFRKCLDGGGLIGSKQRADHRINRVPDYSIPDVKRAFLQRPPRLPSNGMLRDLVGRS